MAGQVVGTAILELIGDTSQFRAELNRAAGTFRGMTERLGRAGTLLTRSVTLPLAAVATGAVAAAVRMDTLQRSLTAVTGSTEATNAKLRELKEVAKLPGLGLAEAVEGQVRLQAVGVEAGRATRALAAFGNAIATTGGGRNELARVTLQLGQLSAKGKILAQDLRPIIEAAPAVGRALREAFGTVDAQEIEELGLSTDEFIDRLIAQLETLPRVTGGARNAFENFGDALLQAGSAIASPFLPALTNIVNKFSEVLLRVSETNPKLVGLGVVLAGLAAAAGPVLIVIGKLPALFALVKAGALVLAGAFTPVTLALAAVAAAVVAGIYVWRRWGDDIKRIVSTTVEAVKSWLVDRFNAIVDSARAGIEKIRDAWAWLKDVLVGNSIVIEMVDSIAEQFRRIGPEVVQPLQRQTQEIAGSFERLGEQMERIALSGIDAFAEFATGSGNAINRFVNQAIADLARLAARLAIIKALQFAFPGSGFVAGLADLAGIGERASGGPVLANRPYVVGERGPELFVPQSAGQVVAAGAFGGTVRFDTSGLPPIPQPVTPEVYATHDWYRRLFSHAIVDWRERGGLG